jgi:predicted enzyme related to lactoylglutathione lyase
MQEWGVVILRYPVLGCDDLERAVQFWSRLLDYRPRADHRTDRWCTLDPCSGTGGSLALQLSNSPVQDHPRMHLDLGVHGPDEQEALTDRVCALGGRLVDWDQYPTDPDFVVVADSDGNRFCLVDLDHA